MEASLPKSTGSPETVSARSSYFLRITVKLFLSVLFSYMKQVSEFTFLVNTQLKAVGNARGGGGYFRNFWVGMCRRDPGTLNLYHSYFS